MSRPGPGPWPTLHGLGTGAGAGARAAIAMGEAARANALLDGRPTVGFEDVTAVAKPVMNHRLILNYQALPQSILPLYIFYEINPQYCYLEK